MQKRSSEEANGKQTHQIQSKHPMPCAGVDGEAPFSKRDAMIGYKIMEQECPFPAEDLRKAVPLSWHLAEGLAGGLSLDPGCEYTHLFTMASLRLNCVKVRTLPEQAKLG